GIEAAPAAQERVQALAVGAAHHEVGRSVRQEADVAHLRDARVVHGAADVRLTHEALADRRVVRDALAQHLEHHLRAVDEAGALEGGARSPDPDAGTDLVAILEDRAANLPALVRHVWT